MATKQLVETSIWRDDWFVALSEKSKLIFLYLLTNNSLNPAGLYEPDKIHIRHIFGVEDIKLEVDKLKPVVLYDAQKNVIWIKKYFIKNSKGEKMNKSVQNSLDKYNSSILSKEFIKFYKHFDFKVNSIEYQYTLDDVSILSNDNDNEQDSKRERETTYSSAEFDFKQIYDAYPHDLRRGYIDMLKLYLKELNQCQDSEDIKKAFNNYISSEKVKRGYGQGMDKFFKEWHNWVITKEAIEKEEVDKLLEKYQ